MQGRSVGPRRDARALGPIRWHTLLERQPMDASLVPPLPPSSGDLPALVAQARAGDQTAIESLLARYRPLLAQTVRHCGVDPAMRDPMLDTEDLWQEAAYAFLTLLHTYDPTRGVPFGGYLRAFLPWHMRHSLHSTAHEPLLRADEEALAAIVDDRDDFDAVVVRELFQRLSPLQCQVMDAMYVRNLTVADVAAMRGVTSRAITATRRRALHALRPLLAEAPRPPGAQS